MTKALRVKNEPKFKGRPTDASFEQIKEGRENAKKALVLTKKNLDKVDKFIGNFVKCNGNATKAAMKTFGYDNRFVAATVGSRYMKKTKELARLYMEGKGVTYGKMLEVAINKMQVSKSPEWWDRLMKLAGYEDFISKSKGGVAVNIISAQRDVLKDYVTEIEEGEIVAGSEVQPSVDGEEDSDAED